MPDELELLTRREQQIPGGVHYAICRYRLQSQAAPEELGSLVYHYHPRHRKERYLELRFCISGNRFCNDPACSGGACTRESRCAGSPTFDVLVFRYPSAYLIPFVRGNQPQTPGEELLSFRLTSSFSTTVNLCDRTRRILDNLLGHPYQSALENIYVNSQLQALLLYGLECLVDDRAETSFACKFMGNEADREKIVHAREILLQRIGDPITIRELSRKVGTNECYLKKGFKELFGTTIFDFYQTQRMEHARYLLYEKGLSVTEVSELLGYSSISHFSTAFKRHTGIKPCELLFRS